ncbi:MAG: NDP-sugar synthase [archaeon]
MNQVLVLAGGYGTRLRPLTLKTPKELLPILGKPAIDYLLENLSRNGFRDVTLSVNDTFHERLRNHIGSGKQFGLDEVSFVVEKTGNENQKLGAVGALEFIASQTNFNQDTLIVGADNFSPYFDFRGMFQRHRETGAEASIGLYKFPHRELLSQMGIAEILPGGKIVRFHEKPKEPPSDLISTAMYFVSPDFFSRHVPEYVSALRARGEKPDNLGQIWEHLLGRGHYLGGFVSPEFWIDIGKPQGYFLANEFMLGKRLLGKPYFAKGAKLGKGIIARGPTLVEAGAEIGENVVFEKHNHVMGGATVGDNSLLENCLIFPGAKIEDGCALQNCIVSEGAEISEGTTVSGAEHQIVGGPISRN